jgi:cobalt-zinc-cadmium efflux system membrane fusion protein
MRKRWFIWVGQGVLAAVGVTGLFLAVPLLKARFSSAEHSQASEAREGQPRLVGPGTVRLEADVVDTLGIKLGEVRSAERSRVLPALLGSLTLDPSQLARVQARFPFEVMSIGMTKDQRPLDFGDEVKAGDLLAILSCRELGEKKCDLVDAWSQLQLDTETLARTEELFREGVVPDSRVRQVRRSVESSKVALRRAEQTLRIWQVEEKEIERLIEEARRLRDAGQERSAALAADWARVEIRAPLGGTILERNVNPREIVNDPTRDLFKIANLKQLKVWAYAAQEDVPVLMELPQPLRWSVHLRTDATTCVTGTVERISNLVDVAQRAVVLIGSVNNDHGRLRAGQLISATIETAPVQGDPSLEVPTAALVEDGEESVVFVVQSGTTEYRLCPVKVIRRFRDVVLVQPQGAGLLASGASVVTAGAVELKTILENLQAAPKREFARANP